MNGEYTGKGSGEVHSPPDNPALGGGRGPALLLFFLAPAVGELLSSSAPPAEFFHPVGFVLLTCLYGGGAILCRELTLHWSKGWWTLLVLGAAYGMVEEGLMVKSFYNPNWGDAGILGSYGRWGGVNWVWSLNLTLYHAVISIAIPVLLVGLVFPERRTQAWVSRRWFRVLVTLFVLTVLIGFATFGDGGSDDTPFRPPAIPYASTVAAVMGLAWLAKRLPEGTLASPVPEDPALQSGRALSIALFIIGFLGVFLFYVFGFGLAEGSAHPVVALVAVPGYVAILTLLVLKLTRHGARLGQRRQWSLAAGMLGFFIAFTPVWEFGAERPDNTTGMTLVGIVAAIFLIGVRWRIGRTVAKG